MKRDPNPTVRRAQRVLLMVHELHKLGHQRLRIAPGMSPSGMHWRCSVTHVGNILRSHGAMVCRYDRDVAQYTTGQENNYFGWEDAQQDTARQLAAKFLDRFPAIARLGQGTDWPYAGWYVEMVGYAERGHFPVAYSDYQSGNSDYIASDDKGQKLPLPPPGEAEPLDK